MLVIPADKLPNFAASIAGHKGAKAVKAALVVWFAEVSRATWSRMVDVKSRYATASVINSERVVFNIKGNDYRLVVAMDFEKQIALVRWIGTHAEYDKIDVAKV